MELSPKEKTPSFLPSPTSSSSSSNGQPPKPPSPNPNPPTVTRSDPSNPYPTTFVQADTSSFKQVVQMLTGSPDPTHKPPSSPKPTNPIPPIKPTTKSKPSTKLYERRNNSLKHLLISPLLPPPAGCNSSPRNIHSPLSPSLLDFPSLVLSPVTPLIHDPFNRSPNDVVIDRFAEDKAIKEKGFFLHPSPRSTTPRDSEPRLLPLFPVSSPRAGSNNYHHHHHSQATTTTS